uniref:Uncharacterized protein n=1 Tax=Setaria viridis TaxID=4556 RepID=A0A4U6W648_SETVI|nr:hypothetical protein SEVIR_1G036050v2 [Setaria viridis]
MAPKVISVRTYPGWRMRGNPTHPVDVGMCDSPALGTCSRWLGSGQRSAPSSAAAAPQAPPQPPPELVCYLLAPLVRYRRHRRWTCREPHWLELVKNSR